LVINQFAGNKLPEHCALHYIHTTTDNLLQSFFVTKGETEKKRILALHHAYQQKRRLRFKRIVYCCAATVLLALGTWLLWQQHSLKVQQEDELRKKASTEIVAEQSYPQLLETYSKERIKREKVLMSPPQQENEGWKSAYDEQKLGQVVAFLGKKSILDDKESFYLGLCYFQNTPSQAEKAIEIWSKTRKNSDMQDQIQWWIALANLRLGNIVEAKKELVAIKKGAYKYSAAQILLTSLQKEE
jgi:hypothetical protein